MSQGRHHRRHEPKAPRPQVVAATGASAGIGRATAIAFGRRGDRVAVIARGGKGLEAAAQDVCIAGGQALCVQSDVADAEPVGQAVRRIEDERGPVAVWVNVACTSVFSRFEGITAKEFARVTEVSYLGYGRPSGSRHSSW